MPFAVTVIYRNCIAPVSRLTLSKTIITPLMKQPERPTLCTFYKVVNLSFCNRGTRTIVLSISRNRTKIRTNVRLFEVINAGAAVFNSLVCMLIRSCYAYVGIVFCTSKFFLL